MSGIGCENWDVFLSNSFVSGMLVHFFLYIA